MNVKEKKRVCESRRILDIQAAKVPPKGKKGCAEGDELIAGNYLDQDLSMNCTVLVLVPCPGDCTRGISEASMR